MDIEKFEKISWIPFDLSRRICNNLYYSERENQRSKNRGMKKGD